MRAHTSLLLAGLALSACTGSGGESPEAAAPQPATASPSEAASVVAPAPKQAATSPAARPVVPAAPVEAVFVAAGTSHLALELSAPFDLAGFELHLAFQAADFKAGQPEITDQLQGFLCAANPDIVGGFKYICASVPARRAEGVLATVPISWSGRPPTLADLIVEKVAVVDVDSNPAPKGVELKLTVVD